MRRTLAVTLAVALLEAGACVPHAARSTITTPARRPAAEGAAMRYLALGDSYTIGESVTPAERWPVQLAARLVREGVAISQPEIVARTGWTTAELAAGIDAARPRGPFDLVTVQIGVNNQYRGRELAEYRGELEALLRRAREFAGGNAERVIVVSIPDWGVTPFAAGRDRAHISADIDRFNRACREVTLAAGAHWIDVTPISRRATSRPELIAADGLHPSGAMYSDWVEQVLPEALEVLRAPRH